MGITDPQLIKKLAGEIFQNIKRFEAGEIELTDLYRTRSEDLFEV